MHLLVAIILGAGVAFAQSLSPATPPSGTQVDNIPVLGLGTWHIHDRGANVTEIIASAIQTGYRHIDCAAFYDNQKQIGVGIKEGLRRTGLSRKDLWITSKLWNDKHGNPEGGIKETLKELDLDYLDLFLIHWPVSSSGTRQSIEYIETWKGMETLVEPGKLTRFLGISNFSPKQTDDVLAIAKIKPKVLQIELHPYLQQDDFVASTLKKGIQVTAWAPLGNTNSVYAMTGGNRAPKMLTNSIINEIAKAKGCTAAQVSLAWNMARSVAVIPKAAQIQHQKENMATIEKCKLDSQDMRKMKSVQGPLRMITMPCNTLRNVCFEGLEGV